VLAAPEVLEENRFLAARDGIAARFVDLERDELVPAREHLAHTLDRVREHAEELGCESALDEVRELARRPGAAWQRAVVAEDGLAGLPQRLVRRFSHG
jgi:carboxylate-amine ligase